MTRKKKLALLFACLTGTGMMSTAAAEEHPQTETAEEHPQTEAAEGMNTYDLPETTVIGVRRHAVLLRVEICPVGFMRNRRILV